MFVIDHLKCNQKILNALECQLQFFTSEFLGNFLQNDYLVVQFLWKLLSNKNIRLNHPKIALVENPFDHGSSNIFAEEIHVIEQSKELMKVMVETKRLSVLQAFHLMSISATEIQEDIKILETLTQSGFLDKGECILSEMFIN